MEKLTLSLKLNLKESWKRGDQKVNVEEWRSGEIKVCNSYRIKKHLENNDNEKTHAPTFSSIEWHT